MRYKQIIYILGWVLKFQSAFLAIPGITGLIYREYNGALCFFVTALACLFIGLLLSARKPGDKSLFAREGFAIVTFAWLLMGLTGAIPMHIVGKTPSYIDALFETVSGFTTTGATIFPSVEELPRCILMWRSFTHWIGGMGVLVFIMAILPLAGGYNMNIMKAESPGPSVGKLVPHVRKTAELLYIMYIVLTALQLIMLLIGKMPLFDAINIAFATAGTGGFGIVNDSVASYSTYIQIVITVSMVLFGVNFSVYYLIIAKKFKDVFKLSEVPVYLLIFTGSSLLIGFNIMKLYTSLGTAMKHSFFQVASIMSTTGFATTDFNHWPEFSRTMLTLLMFVGACAGSTGGGMKVSRLMILFKTLHKELQMVIHPRSVKAVKFDSKLIPHEVLRATNVYVVMYVLVFALSLLALSLNGHDFTTNFTAVTTTINNVGPGLNKIGPIYNFGFFSDFSKFVMIFDMLAGRLELLPILVLLAPGTWKS